MPRTNYSDADEVSVASDEVAVGPSSPTSPTSPIFPPYPAPVTTLKRGDDDAQHTGARRGHTGGPVVIDISTSPSPGDTLVNVQRPPSAAVVRFRRVVDKVIDLRRTSHAFARGLAGAEPGIDTRRNSTNLLYGHIKERCNIQVTDYGAVNISMKDMDNEGLRAWLGSDGGKRPSWSKVRWISVGGISYDVIRDLQLHFDLHPLAIEDVLHQHPDGRAKADYYSRWLFVRILAHLKGDDDSPNIPAPESIIPSPKNIRSASPRPIDSDDGKETEVESQGSDWFPLRKRKGVSSSSSGKGGLGDPEFLKPKPVQRIPTPLRSIIKADRTRKAHIKAIEKLKEGERVNVLLKNLCIFCDHEGTIITFFADPNIDFTAPILLRLQQKDSLIRKTCDSSLLIHAMLDLVVDNALEVMETYHEQIVKLERQVLLQPEMSTVRRLHILSGDLILHKRTLEPLKALIYSLRRYDLDRCMALVESDPFDHTPRDKVKGFMSHKTKVYLADVHDHMEQILSNADMFSAMAENLIGYSFNLSSFQMNQVMRRFTIVTIICLPLTFLTGYFGQNFAFFEGKEHSDLFFWEIAIPVLAFIIAILLYSDFIRMIHYIRKTSMTERIAAAYQRH
ncbi:hypothetical protein SISSUDRAFT_1127996 [Sistotremastrum suecicum HHB10207 ss-3]|uniref:Cora-domain-containing protein n=1 Tax=Sistotremastrum suecicum HHB10207 ss-3 TaxID=1314776 RepID=A0A166EE35_9AGAM|nr:hypothetical protein SISSUDRAFT_1127996 [Sistotremastrum suecicum HHB10207 ss-3]